MKKTIYIPTSMKDHMIDVDDLVPYDNNPRKHKPKGIKALTDSIQMDGFVIPITVDQDNRIIAGHGRRLAAMQLQMKQVPVVKIHVSEEEYARLVISDNKIAELSSWDNKLLKDAMEYLDQISDAELFVPGFEDEDLDKVFGNVYKETLETTADFGDAGDIDVMDEATRVTSMTFKMSVRDHKKIKAVVGAVMRENDFETTGEALCFMAHKFKGPSKAVRRNA